MLAPSIRAKYIPDMLCLVLVIQFLLQISHQLANSMELVHTYPSPFFAKGP